MVDSEANRSTSCQSDYVALLKGGQREFRLCGDATAALELARAETFDVVVIEWELSGEFGEMSGPELSHGLRQFRSDVPVIFVTRELKPCLDQRIRLPRTALVKLPTTAERFSDAITAVLSDGASKELEDLLDAIHTRDPILREALVRIVRARSAVQINILITGPTGTGKEHLARAIHQLMHGPGQDERFFHVHLPGIQADRLESALFGHVKGSFTGAHRDHKGVFEEAEGGTVFLDEIGGLAPEVYTKLLRVVATTNRSYARFGEESKENLFTGRIIAATRQDLQADVAKGAFPEDLYHRLSKPYSVRLPTLREWKEHDFDHLVEHLKGKYAADLHLSSEARDALVDHDWPGNIREMEETLKDAAIQCRGRSGTHIDPRDLPETVFAEPQYSTTSWQPDFAAFLHRHGLDAPDGNITECCGRLQTWYDACVLIAALKKEGGAIGKAAQRVGLDRKTFRTRLKAARKALGR
jgi:DNA-binding NtrC family response regulator